MNSEAAQAAERLPAAPVLLESVQDGIATLTLNRPDRLNALNCELGTALAAALSRVAEDPNIRAVVLAGAGRAFCAGGDLREIGTGRESGNAAALEPLLRAGMRSVLMIRSMPKPVVAAVNGAAAGAGMNIALAADIRIASEDAVFGQNFAKVGLFPDFGGTYFLPQLVGPAKAAEMFYTGEMIGAAEALRLGIVNRVVAGEQLAATAAGLAKAIAQGPPLAIRGVKEILFGRQRAALEAALEAEVQQQMRCFQSADCREGIHAFFEKRAPKFEGR